MARDIASSREAILATAEAVFAERGYDAASMQTIADAAGVSRGMPGYAFGSKAALYEAVLERAFAVPRALTVDVAGLADQDRPVEALRVAIEAYVDFLAGHPTYVRLLSRVALDRGARLGQADVHRRALDAAVESLGQLLQAGGLRSVDPRHLVVSVLALCFFPFAHRDTLLAPLDLDPADPRFLAERKAHVVDLLLHGLLDDH